VAHLLSNLSESIFSTLNLAGAENSLDLPMNPAKRECLLLVDGMGVNALEQYGSHLPHLQSLRTLPSLEATFPSTTATSLTTLGTGVLSGRHGMVGYTMRVPHSGRPERILNALKWDDRVDPRIWQSEKTLFERAVEGGVRVSHIAAKRYQETGFTQAALRGAEYFGVQNISEIARSAREGLKEANSFTYLYINNVDEASHSDGFGSDKFRRALAKVNDLVGELIQTLPSGSRLWVTSDHGMINRDEYVVLGKSNNLLEDVDLLAGEPRVRYLYLADGAVDDVISRWQEFFGSKVTIFTREEGIDRGLFGSEVRDNIRERIGDLIVIANERLILVEKERESQQISMVGHHGGTTLDETAIPLLNAEI